MAQPTKRDLLALTGLRFFAAFHVVLYHYAEPTAWGMPRWLGDIVAGGSVSVSLFFVLSGFILTYAYANPDGDCSLDRRAFWAARFARIYPVYLLALVLLAPYLVGSLRGFIGGDTGLLATFKALVVAGSTLGMMQAWVPHAAAVWSTPGWSVSAEVFFYLLFPFLLPLFGRLGRRQLLLCLTFFCSVVLIVPAAYDFLDPDGLKGLPEMRGVWTRVLAYNPLLHLPKFMIGMATGWLFLRSPGDVLGSRRHSGWLAMAALLAIIAGLIGGARLSLPPMHVLLAPLFALLIYALASGGGVLGALLSRPIVVFLGEISYALYLLQKPLWLAWQAIDERLAPDGATDYARFRFFLVYVVSLLVASALAYWIVERPARDALRRFLIRRGHSAPTEASARRRWLHARQQPGNGPESAPQYGRIGQK